MMGRMMRTRRARTAGPALAVVGVLVATLLVGQGPARAEDPPPADPNAAPAAPAPAPLPTALGSWCTALFPPLRQSLERKRAQELMAGRVDLGKGGYQILPARPNWKPQSTSDTSGDRHINSLNWALPLLYRGVRVQNAAMIDRFRQLLYWWIEDHQGRRDYWVDGSIYGGLRTQTLVCAAQTLNDPVLTAAALRDSQTMIRSYRGHAEISLGVNNTDLIRQTGALAAYCWVNDAPGRERAWQNIVSMSRGVVNDDGSDTEGSPGYAVYIEALLHDAERAAATCGISPEPLPTLRGQLYQFVAQAVRPDFRLESLGDTIVSSLRGSFGVGDWRADWIRTAGQAGAPPSPVYRAFDGGYVFARAGWNPAPGGADTFYSLRFSSSRPATAHTHDDGGSMSLFARGVSWIADPGPYRYENGSALRGFIKTRTAHSSLTVTAPRARGGVQAVRTGSNWQQGGNDDTCLVDRTWSGTSVTRCVTYVRSVDAVIVVDYVTSSKRKRSVTQRWQVAPGIGAEATDTALTLMAGDKRMDIYRGGPGGWQVDVARQGSSVGWHTGAWGERKPGAVLSRTVPLRRKATEVLVTVFVPRVDGESVPVTIDANGVTVTRNGTTITTPLPAAP
jgi:hypothetical protein